MPDWSYQTVLRPLLFRLRPETGRDFALGAMGRLASLPGGVQVIRLLGHMAPDPRLRLHRAGIKFLSPVGLGCRLDPKLKATRALAEFGVGFLEVGPIAAEDVSAAGAIVRDAGNHSLLLAAPQAATTATEARRQLAALGKPHAPLLARIEPESAQQTASMIATLTPAVDAFVTPFERLDFCAAPSPTSDTAPRPLMLAVTADDWRDPVRRLRCERAAREGQVAGIVVDAPRQPDGTLPLGAPGRADALATIRAVRAALGASTMLIAGVGIHEPADALDAVAAGADLVQIDSGLVLTGPGLVKRINEAFLFREQQCEPTPAPPPTDRRVASESWFWALLLGLSLFGGGVLALGIAATRVVLPYDEALSGLSRDQLAAINPQLLDFMTHDRVTLAGTMLAVGLLYSALAWFGIRRGQHWAYVTVATSALAGFFTFFAFLGFGYFDPFHAFTSAILLQLTFLAMHARLPPCEAAAAPDLHNDEAWRSHQWGQLLFVVHGAVLIVAGLVITSIGMTQVFIKEDLDFLQTTAEALNAAHPQLKPLVAHDRATFGGMLIACGLATLLPALWGFRRGEAWLWWTLMISGTVAYLAALAVHVNVGYSSHLHLLPVYGGLLWLWAGGLFSYPFMVSRHESLDAEWQRRLR